MRRAAALIVGGGPAGAAAAITLARGHAKPLLVERSAGDRDVVCGGFLGWDALASLRRLGLEPASLGARPIHSLRFVAGEQIVETALPGPAAGLSRRRLDSALLALAEQAGTVVLRGRTARLAEGRIVRLDDGEEIHADALFLATGKRELRGAARSLEHRSLSVGLRASLPGTPALARALDGLIELHLFDGGYAGLLVQEDGSVNLCLTVPPERVAAGPDVLLASLAAEAPSLADRVGGAALRWDAIAGVPYGWSARSTEAGVYRLGDQAAVIASLAGDGVAMALASGMQAAQAFLTGDGSGDYQRAFSSRARRPLVAAELMRSVAAHRRRRPLLMTLAKVPLIATTFARLTRIG